MYAGFGGASHIAPLLWLLLLLLLPQCKLFLQGEPVRVPRRADVGVLLSEAADHGVVCVGWRRSLESAKSPPSNHTTVGAFNFFCFPSKYWVLFCNYFVCLKSRYSCKIR